MKDIAVTVEEAKKGSSSAFSELFELTQEKAYYTALKITKNSEDAQDIMQEAYVKAFTSLNTLNDSSKFASWLNCIVANKARNFVVKKRPNLFSEYDSDDGLEFEDMLENKDDTLIPHELADNKETKKLVLECIERLPDEQKICIIMFYYDELSVKEIAGALNISEGTVKSRLNLARKKLKKDFENLEKNGTKLYGIGFAPLLLWIFMVDSERQNNKAPFIRNIEKSVIAELEKTAGTVAAQSTFFATLTGKVIAVIVTAAVVAGTATAALWFSNNKDKDVLPVSVTTETSTAEAETEEKAVKESYHFDGMFAVCDDKDNMFYLTDSSVIERLANESEKTIFKGKANNLLYIESLYFTSKGKLYSYSDSLNEIMDVKSSMIYYIDDKTLLGISDDKTKAYIISLDNLTENKINIDATDIVFEDGYLYYRDKGLSVLKADPLSPEKANLLVKYYDENKIKTPYYPTRSGAYFSDFYSDETGDIYYSEIGTAEKTKINLGNSVVDFSVGGNSIYYCDYNGDLYYSDMNGEGRHLISKGNYGYSCSSGGYQIWYNAEKNNSVLIKDNSDEIALVLNGCITNAQIVNSTVFYKVNGSLYQSTITKGGD